MGLGRIRQLDGETRIYIGATQEEEEEEGHHEKKRVFCNETPVI